MKNAQITIPYEAEKLAALRRYAAKKGVSIEGELTDTINKLYEKIIPSSVREYIEDGLPDESAKRPSTPRRSQRNSEGNDTGQ